MVIDFHTHILPEIDDGSDSLEESIALLKMEAEQGIRFVIATPHFYAHRDTPEKFLERRNIAERRLRDEMRNYEGLPDITIGAEVYFFPGMSGSKVLQELTIRNTRCILIEMPPPPWTEQMYQELQAVYDRQGLIPIIAHVDRYIGPFRTHNIPKRLEELPVYVQANASFFIRKETSRMARKMLQEGKIHLLGSDCHNMDSRKPNLENALQVILDKMGKKAIHKIKLYEREVLFGK
jgi:protein-tyrosine phosphatase